jgi:hypothetical protein
VRWQADLRQSGLRLTFTSPRMRIEQLRHQEVRVADWRISGGLLHADARTLSGVRMEGIADSTLIPNMGVALLSCTTRNETIKGKLIFYSSPLPRAPSE